MGSDEGMKELINEGNKNGERIEVISREFDPIPNASDYNNDDNPNEIISQKEDCYSRHGGLKSKKLGGDTF